jgi:hypothetical protein
MTAEDAAAMCGCGAKLWRSRCAYGLTPKTGARSERPSGKWWGRYRDAEGIMRRVSLASSKAVAQRMLAEIVEKVELQKPGVVTTLENDARKPIEEHLAEFESHLKAKNNHPRYIFECMGKIRRAVRFCGWRWITDITGSSVERFLSNLREIDGLSICTSNHYLKVIKTFCNWLVVSDKLIKTPLMALHA